MFKSEHRVEIREASVLRRVPVVQQDVGPPDLVVGESDVGHTWIVGHVPLQVEIRPVLQTHTNTDVFAIFIPQNVLVLACFTQRKMEHKLQKLSVLWWEFESLRTFNERPGPPVRTEGQRSVQDQATDVRRLVSRHTRPPLYKFRL